MSEPVGRLANRAAADPFFLAFALAEYAAAENLDEAGLAAALGVAAEALPHVRLCPAPRADPAGFRADVAAVAARFGLDADKLAAAVRLGQGLATLRGEAAAAEPGVLLAARDAETPPPPGPPS